MQSSRAQLFRPRSAIAGLVVVLAAVAGGTRGCHATRSSAPVCLAGAKTTPAGACRSQRAPLHRIPFRAGYETEVMQGYHGYRTHKKDLAYSIDFKCELGTPVVASRSGVVWATREDSNRGCNDPSCVDEGNYVILDHGDGTYSEYHHLQQFGAIAEVGEQICRGEVVGLCGDTGYTSGPHLHFAVTDVTHRTVPTRISRLDRQRYPFAVPESKLTSRNDRELPCGETPYSSLPEDAFAHHGVVLDDPIPLVVDRGETRTEIAGTYHGDHPKVAVHRRSLSGGDWIDECIELDERGRFRGLLEWPTDQIESGFFWLMITGADEKCRSPGWAWSYKVRVD